jgi:hypothetical protein
MRRFLRDNGLSLLLLFLFMGTWVGQAVTGIRQYNEQRRAHHLGEVGMKAYLTSGHFWEITAENWESEFLQMAMFVLLTCCLYQKGSPEARDPDKEDPVDNDPRLQRNRPGAPWPVRKGGFVLWLYSNSLSLTFLLLFGISVYLHARHGAREYNEDQQMHGEPTVTAIGYMGTSRFWFESLQNWQSEFLSLAAMVWLSVYLRQRGSAESKPVATPHDEDGSDEGVVKAVGGRAKERELAGVAE